jgi:pimeloyl-ACP methyl ester carboxylesterase
MSLTVPAPTEVHAHTTADGASILLRRYGNAAGPRLVMSHGNGLAIDPYVSFWGRFLDDYEVVLYDLRNHGQNPLHGPANHDYPHFVADLAEILRALPALWGKKPTATVNHSAAALTSLYLILDDGLSWDAAVLFDPALVPPDGHDLREQAISFEHFMADWAKERPDRFASPQVLAEGFKAARQLSKLVASTHELLAESTLRQTEEGDWTLACPRDMESRVYRANADQAIWFDLERLKPISERLLIVSGDPDRKGAQSPAKTCPVAAKLFGLQQLHLPDTGHMMQMEDPAGCHGTVVDFFGKCGFGG